jgi:D-glycero-D-manno-heptose 1,7-bisphosphate phosphatase
MKERAILFDRDGTLIVDRPEETDPASIHLMPNVGEAMALAREWDFALAIVTNQPAIAAGMIDREQLFAMHARIEELAGPVDGWFVCFDGSDEGYDGRKPQPALILAASERLGVIPGRCVVIGDIGADVEAARAAGARAILVPTPSTPQEEIAAAPVVAHDVLEAVQRIVAGAV